LPAAVFLIFISAHAHMPDESPPAITAATTTPRWPADAVLAGPETFTHPTADEFDRLSRQLRQFRRILEELQNEPGPQSRQPA